MPRIPETEIARIKESTDLIALIQSRGIALKQQGSNWIGLCPFHEDSKSPNLIVTPGKGLFRCMACEATGNAIQFVEKFDGLSFRHAFELLANGGKAAFEQAPDKPMTSRASIPRLACPLDEAASDAALCEQVSRYYQSRLAAPENQAARDYLASRGLDDPEQWKSFGIGFADRTLGLRIPENNRKQGAEIRDRLKALGIYRPNGREHLNGCITVPIRNAQGDIVQLYGRRIERNTPKENRHLYLARPIAGIFHPDALKHRELILTESILDALTFHLHGMEAVTCTFGTKHFTDELFAAILAAKVGSVRLAFDADEEGEKAFAKASTRLQAEGITVYQIKFPWEMDANQYAIEQGGEALRHAVRNATWTNDAKAELASIIAPVQSTSSLAAKKEEVPPSPEPSTTPQPHRKPLWNNEATFTR